MHTPHEAYLLVGQWTLGTIPPVALVNNTSVVMGVQTSLQVPAFNCLRQMPRSGIAVAYGSSMVFFKIIFILAMPWGLQNMSFPTRN